MRAVFWDSSVTAEYTVSVAGSSDEILSASSFSLLQREFSLVPELVWAGALRVCDQSTEQSRALPWWPWLPASRCILGSCGCRLAVWQSELYPPPPHDNPHFPSALPRLDSRPHMHPSWPYHHFPSCHMQPNAHLGWSAQCGRDDFLNAVASDWGTKRELWPACCHSDLTVI